MQVFFTGIKGRCRSDRVELFFVFYYSSQIKFLIESYMTSWTDVRIPLTGFHTEVPISNRLTSENAVSKALLGNRNETNNVLNILLVALTTSTVFLSVTMALSEERYLKPADILFTQDSISAKFQNGARIRDVLQALLDKRIKVSDIPLMRIVKNFNKWWSFDNRRLWLFREMASRGRCEEVKVRIIPFDEDEWEKKYTTKNGGKSVHIRGRLGNSFRLLL